jgi:hypothetical protein
MKWIVTASISTHVDLLFMHYIFLLAGQNQFADFQAVAARLRDTTGISLESGSTGSAEELASEVRAHVPTATPQRATALLLALEKLRRAHGQIAIVTGQDVGILQRVALSWAKRRGCPSVLLPDGIAFEAGDEVHSPSMRSRLRSTVDRALVGDHRALGKSNPRLIMSWGEGWNDFWRAHAPTAEIVVTGSPRADQLQSVKGVVAGRCRVLLCSQPMWSLVPASTVGELRDWYRWLGRSAERLSGDVDVRIRLHPAELENSQTWSGHNLDRFILSEPVKDELGWATHVVAPASTIALEASTLGRHVALVSAVDAICAVWERSPLFSVPKWTRIDSSEPLSLDRLDFRPIPASDYLGNVGNATSSVVQALLDRFN